MYVIEEKKSSNFVKSIRQCSLSSRATTSHNIITMKYFNLTIKTRILDREHVPFHNKRIEKCPRKIIISKKNHSKKILNFSNNILRKKIYTKIYVVLKKISYQTFLNLHKYIHNY